MKTDIDRFAVADVAHLASVVAFLRTFAKEAGVDIGRLPGNPTLSQLQKAARKCGLVLSVDTRRADSE